MVRASYLEQRRGPHAVSRPSVEFLQSQAPLICALCEVYMALSGKAAACLLVCLLRQGCCITAVWLEVLRHFGKVAKASDKAFGWLSKLWSPFGSPNY